MPPRSYRRSGPWELLFAGTIFLGILCLLSPAAGTAAVRPMPGSFGAVPEVQPATPVPTPHGNFLLNVTNPDGFVEAGSRISVVVRVNAPGYPATAPTANLRLPGSVAAFPVTGGALHVYVPAQNYTVLGGGNATATGGASLRMPGSDQFTRGALASLSSQGFAVMASWPVGEYTVSVQWSWKVIDVAGAAQNGSWSPTANLSPAQEAWLATPPPSTVSPGAAYPVCLAGPIANQSFAIHFSYGTENYLGPTVQVPVSATGPYCWNTTLPASIPPQTLEAHVWEYAATTYLLYEIPLVLGNASVGGHASGGPWYAPIAPGGAGFVPFLVVVILVAGALIAWRIATAPGRPPDAT